MFNNQGRKGQSSFGYAIITFFGATNPYKKIDEQLSVLYL